MNEERKMRQELDEINDIEIAGVDGENDTVVDYDIDPDLSVEENLDIMLKRGVFKSNKERDAYYSELKKECEEK